MKTTIYLDSIIVSKIGDAALRLNISKDEIIEMLLTILVRKSIFRVKPLVPVKYQDSSLDINWKTLHIDLEPVFYEKALDLRRNYKYSVSWLISYAVKNYLNEVIKKLINSDNKLNFQDNYNFNFVYIAKMFDNIPVFISILGFPEIKYLEKLLS